MNIVMLCDFYNESLEYQENLLVKYYRKHDHAVTVIASTFESVFDYYSDRHDKRLPMRVYEDHGARIIKLPYRFNIRNRLRAYPRIGALLDEARPDLIFVHDIMLNLPDCVRHVQHHPACRMILDYHADYSNSGKNLLSLKLLHGVIRKRYLDRARPYLARIFPVVPASATFLHEVYGIPYTDMELLPLGADTDRGQAVRRQGARARLRAVHGIAEQDCVIFSGGKLDPLKRTEDLIDAVRRLGRNDLHLVVVGDASAPHQDYKALLLQRAAGTPNIHFVGWQDATGVYAHLDMADIAVFPASQSIMWQQAISMGLPLVVGDRSAGQTQDVSYLNTANNIIVLDQRHPVVDELRHNIERLASDATLRQRMSDGARRVASELLDWNTLIEKTLRFNRSPSAAVAAAHLTIA
jgi:glycosyltransferase involved in cell wall biosynthesis